MRLIGNGLIGRSLPDLPCIAFAAGVANSGCTSAAEFARERALLQESLRLDGKFVYFSTCASTVDNPYFRHKAEMEFLVRNRGDYLICRLPPVIGKSDNKATLFNWLHDRISRGERFPLRVETRRNVIDVDDIGTIVRPLLDDRPQTVDIASPEAYSIEEIVAEMESAVGRPAIVQEVEAGDHLLVNTDPISDLIDWSGYLRKAVEKHYT